MRTALMLLGTILALVFSPVGTAPASAAPSTLQAQAATAEVARIDADLAAHGTDVVSALDQFASYYQTELRTNNELTDKQREGIKQNLRALALAKNDYFTLKSTSSAKSGPIVGGPIPPFTAIQAAVAAVIAYFWVNGYVFAADLLTHARVGNTNEIYYPMHHDRVAASPVFQSIKNGPYPLSGSAAFEPSPDKVQQDLYYAVHAFNYYKDSPWITEIWDTYDWEITNDWSSLESSAVELMGWASAVGAIWDYDWEMVFYE